MGNQAINIKRSIDIRKKNERILKILLKFQDFKRFTFTDNKETIDYKELKSMLI